MSRHDQVVAAAAAPVLMDDLARPQVIQYTPAGGAIATTLRAAVGDVEFIEIPTTDGRTRQRSRRLLVHKDPASEFGGVATLSLNAEFLIDGERWAIKEIIADSPTLAEIRVVHSGGVERSSQGFRMRG